MGTRRLRGAVERREVYVARRRRTGRRREYDRRRAGIIKMVEVELEVELDVELEVEVEVELVYFNEKTRMTSSSSL